MHEPRQDFDLLRRFAREGEQSAFADVVRRHLDLVFATALRKVEDRGGAQEVAQNVFAALARKAWRFAPDDSLPAWLHMAALLESKSWLRGELGRRRREAAAAELGTTMKTPDNQSAFHALLPLLDDALLSLREKDRTALLLRFYESQSLREVGIAFGVSEDTAQKRVHSALEKLAEFFKRRGFKTATVAAAAAALQHTATSASATAASAVAAAALEAAPPVLAGLSALLARLVGLSRVQTATVCVALVAAPVGLQLHERHAAGEAVKRYRTQLLAAQNESAILQTEIERVRVSAERLEQSVAQANEAAARAAESAQAFETWKQKIRAQLTAADYRWPEDSPFVRIPKALLPELSELSQVEPFARPGVIKPYARELLGLTPSELSASEEILRRHFAELGRLSEARIYETNQPLRGRVVASERFVLPAPGEEANQRADQTLAEMRGILGEERWPLVQVRLKTARGGATYSRNSYSLTNILYQPPQEFSVWVDTDNKGELQAHFVYSGLGLGYGNNSLSLFLPGGDPDRTNALARLDGAVASESLCRRAEAWLQEQALARLGRKEVP